ncbi:serine/threonine-protein kinase [Streptomyces justiciae]|uniref:serine/threonine-protein kinase n=1 Tax=Streptomyces justiciae TaxID=2780140 RepID=UPI002118F986|nr:protein kinase [Streptomyces justiciae]MCW8379575.1 protein kinase [Streptomyces justiciae]
MVEPLTGDDPRFIGPIPLVGRLGAGGMGRVYLGVHERRYVAVKQVLPSIVGEDKKFLRRFGQELDNLASLPAGATAPLLVSDPTAQPPWFATAYVPGLTLGEALDAHGGPLPADALWLLLREAVKGLAAVHELDMVHRDLKPSNVMLTLDGLTLIDFGVARAAEQSQLTSTGLVVGTPAYMSPEQASGARRLTGAVDIFALGSVVAYAACGRPPFGEESGHGVLYRIVHEQPDLTPLRDLDPDLAEVVALCLDKDPEGRPTAAELLRQFEGVPVPSAWPASVAERLAERAAFAADVPELAPPPVRTPTLPDVKPAPTASDRRGRRRTRVFLAVVPVVIVAGGTTLAIQHLPYTSAPESEGRATPSVTVSAEASPSVSVSASASEASPKGKASPSPSKSKASDRGDKGGSGGSDSGSGSGGSGGSGTVNDANDSSSSGSSSSSSGSSSSGSSSSGSSTGSPPPNLTSYRLDYVNSCVGACDMPIKVSWSAVSRATRYDIHYTNKGSNFTAKDVDTVYSTGGTSYTINGPYSGDQVCITVRAANKYGASAWAETWCDTVAY